MVTECIVKLVVLQERIVKIKRFFQQVVFTKVEIIIHIQRASFA